MATAFSYSGTGLESAIQSGSGGIGTGSSITLEVDAVPSDLSQGDTVKVALGPASDWSSGNGETAYGDIGGAGANGGTNITLTDRGQEGTSAASWSEGDPARVGVSGRNDIAGATRPVAQGEIYSTPHNTKDTSQPGVNQLRVAPIEIGSRVLNPEYGVVIDTAGTKGSGNSWVVIYDAGFKRLDYASVDISTAGEKTATLPKLTPGHYLVGFANQGLDTVPTYLFTDFGDILLGRAGTNATLDYRGADYEANIFNETEPPKDLESFGFLGTSNKGIVPIIKT